MTPSASSCAQAVGERGVDEARGAGDLGGEGLEVLLGDGVAVDRDQRAGRAEALGDEAGVAAGAERAVDGDLAGLRVERLDQLAREDRDMGGGHVIRDSEHHAVAGASNAAEMSKMSAASWSL